MLTGRNILVTGGAGFVGRTLVERFLEHDPNVVRIFDNSEPGLVQLERSLDDDRCRFLMGNIRDKDRLQRAMEDIDIVVHTAAMKHVDISEYNPFEAVKTNVVGLQNVIDTAIDTSVRRLVFTSSDKAVNPANTMGTTKLLGEKLVIAGNKYSGRADINLACVRFGNVIDSSGSVIPLFWEQIREGGPVTLTDPRMTRFFLTQDDLVELVTDALELTEGGEVFIHKMPSVRIEDLAEAMIETLAPDYGHDPDDVPIEVTGRRVGETFHEHLMTEWEAQRTVENADLYAILPETGENGYLSHEGLEGFGPAEDITRSSEEARTLDKDEVVELLRTGDILEVGQ